LGPESGTSGAKSSKIIKLIKQNGYVDVINRMTRLEGKIIIAMGKIIKGDPVYISPAAQIA